jgi:hypothetical protein
MDPVARARLRTQHLSHPVRAAPTDVVRELLAVQSQDYLGGKWSVAMRLKGICDADLDRDLDAGRILRTHILRPTWHFVLPEDIRWLLALTSPRVLAQNGTMARKLALDAKTLKRGLDVVQRTLEGGNWRTRDELGEALERAKVKPATGQRLAYIVMQAELEGLIASGPRRGKQFTYGLIDERTAPDAKGRGAKAKSEMPSRDEALAHLATRYFTGHGPATVNDLARWSSLTLADARRAVEAAGTVLRGGEVGGARPARWSGAGKVPARRSAGRVDHLFCVYDEYVNGYRDRSAIFDPAHGAIIVGRGAAVTHVYSLDGQVLGTWSRTIGKQRVEIVLEPFDTRVSRRALEKRLAPAAKEYGAFLRLEAGLSVK